MFDKVAENSIEDETLRCTGLGGTNLWSLPQINFLCSLPHRKGGEYAPLGVSECECVCVCVCVCVTERSQLGLQDNFTL